MLKNKAKKDHTVKLSKRGFTLVELSVVMALVAIIVTMVVSFSVLMSGFINNNNDEYSFLEDYAALKQQLLTWVAENDTPSSQFMVGLLGNLIVKENEDQKEVSFSEGVLSLDTKQISNLDTISRVYFTTNDKLIKCTVCPFNDSGESISEISFVFSLRSDEISVQEGNENE